MRLILYSKPGCHLCEGLQEKLEKIQNLAFELEIRDITTRDDWFLAYQYEVPVLYLSNHAGTKDPKEDLIEKPLPRPSPRASVQQLEQMLRKYLSNEKK
ncbi:thioredoxin family protein [Nostoc sp. T09]|uniref:glutaredoxin family protein n=1 Tax=Nostoc sp. T09 TaxID=1932621 RepID=UPI000A39C359|nr:glutaredoxin family protein [Nostoc sp. T09]OUL30657.1 thioredoxin family protein [Nostoc sp. T09]